MASVALRVAVAAAAAMAGTAGAQAVLVAAVQWEAEVCKSLASHELETGTGDLQTRRRRTSPWYRQSHH